jgi:hypothetical protein
LQVTEAYQQGPAPAQVATTGAVPAKISYQGLLTDGGIPACMPCKDPESWVEDFGTETLVEGKALILIDPLFAATVNLNSDYHVFLTPIGDGNNLFGLKQTSTAFELRESHGGHSNISFHYRIVAKRRGHENVRMERIIIEEPAKADRRRGFAPQ